MLVVLRGRTCCWAGVGRAGRRGGPRAEGYKGYAKVDGIMYHHVYDVDDDDHQWIKWRTTLGSMRAGKLQDVAAGRRSFGVCGIALSN